MAAIFAACYGVAAPGYSHRSDPKEATPRPVPLFGVESETGGEHRAQLAAGVEVVPGRLSHDGDRLRRAPPLESGDDLLDRQQRAGGVLVAVHVDAVGAPGGGVKARVVDEVEEVLERARHVSEVGGRAQE